jgi:hypothetical protein
MARERRLAFLLARVPPAAGFDRLRRIADVDDLVDLVVLHVVRLEIRRAGRNVHELAIHAPHAVDAVGMRARGVVVRDLAGLFGLADVPDREARRLVRRLDAADLVRNDHQVADDLDRIRAHLAVREVGLNDDFRLLRVGHVDAGEVLRRAFMAEPHDAAAVLGLVHPHAFADAAKAVELVLRNELHVERKLVLRLRAAVHSAFSHLCSLGPFVGAAGEAPARFVTYSTMLSKTGTCGPRPPTHIKPTVRADRVLSGT